MSHTILSSTHVPMAAEVLSWLFYKYTFSSCEAERIRRRRVADSLGVVINTGQGRGRVGKCLHARAGNTTAERSTRDKQSGIVRTSMQSGIVGTSM